MVTLGSNAYGVETLGNVKTWMKGKGRQNIPQPAVISHYNKGMGGVDLLDRVLSDMRPIILGKKWYWPLIINALNIAFAYSWCIYKIMSGLEVPQKNFPRHITSIMIRRSHPQPWSASRPGHTFKVADEICLDGNGHYPNPRPVRRCVICKNKLPEFMQKV